jgi:hypothetical protein
MPTSKDPAKAAIQAANLRRTAATTHGAYSAAVIRPARERYLAELAEAFPSASAAEVAIQAQRLAQLEQLGAYMDERGVIRHKRRGDVFPAAALAEKLAAAYERQASILAQRERDRGGASPHDQLAKVVAELTAGEDGES